MTTTSARQDVTLAPRGDAPEHDGSSPATGPTTHGEGPAVDPSPAVAGSAANADSGSADLTPAANEPLGSRFTALLSVTGLANLGDGIVQMGAPLVALTLTRSPGQISLLAAATWLPWLLLGLVGGVIVDRTDRRIAQVVALSTRAALLGVGTWLAISGRLTMPALVGLVLLYGITEVFADLAQSSLVPDLVPRTRLQAANGRVLAVQQVTNTFVGSPLAGAMLALGTGWVFGVPAAMAVVAVVVLLRGVRGRYRAERTEPSSALSDVREGVRYVVHHPVLRPFVLGGGVMNMASTAFFAVFVLWVVGPESQMGMQAEHFPLVTAVLAVGAVIGSLLTEGLARKLPELVVMYTSWIVCVPMMLLPVVWPTVPSLAIAMFVVGFANTIGNTLSQSLRQRIVPRELLGRTTGAGRTIAFGLMPVGALVGGVIAEHTGVGPVLVGATVVAALGVAYPLLTVTHRTIEAAESA